MVPFGQAVSRNKQLTLPALVPMFRPAGSIGGGEE